MHVSGHAGAEELKIVLSIVRPKAFMPVHGEATHLRAHAKLAEATGVPARERVRLRERRVAGAFQHAACGGARPVQSGIVFVDGLSVGDTSQDVLDERNALGAQGFASVAVAVISARRKDVAGEVQMEMHGITGGDDPYLAREARCRRVKGAPSSARSARAAAPKEVKKAARDALLSLLWERTKQRPMVIVNLLEV